MDVGHTEYTVQGRAHGLLQAWHALRKVCISDPGLVVQIALTAPVITAGIVLNLNAIQWVLLFFVTVLFLVAGIMRTAALLQVSHDSSLDSHQVSRIRAMGNGIVMVTSGLAVVTYMLIFIPKILLIL